MIYTFYLRYSSRSFLDNQATWSEVVCKCSAIEWGSVVNSVKLNGREVVQQLSTSDCNDKQECTLLVIWNDLYHITDKSWGVLIHYCIGLHGCIVCSLLYLYSLMYCVYYACMWCTMYLWFILCICCLYYVSMVHFMHLLFVLLTPDYSLRRCRTTG